jgi:hypothetical protein
LTRREASDLLPKKIQPFQIEANLSLKLLSGIPVAVPKDEKTADSRLSGKRSPWNDAVHPLMGKAGGLESPL